MFPLACTTLYDKNATSFNFCTYSIVQKKSSILNLSCKYNRKSVSNSSQLKLQEFFKLTFPIIFNSERLNGSKVSDNSEIPFKRVSIALYHTLTCMYVSIDRIPRNRTTTVYTVQSNFLLRQTRLLLSWGFNQALSCALINCAFNQQTCSRSVCKISSLI